MWCSAVGVIVTLILSLLAVPLTVEAQRAGKVYRIGVLMLDLPAPASPSFRFEVFRQRLRELGFAEGENVVFEDLWAPTFEGMQTNAAELVRRNVDVIVAPSTRAVQAVQHATTTIPIVILSVEDPVTRGFVASLARPASNITGVGGMVGELYGKLPELLKEAVPGVTRMAVLVGDLAHPVTESILRDVESAARALGVQTQLLSVDHPDQFEHAFQAATREGAGTLLLLPDVLFAGNEHRLAALAIEHRLPAIFWRRSFAEAGGLLAYGPSRSELSRDIAQLVGKILKGAKPDDLPFERSTTFELVINLKTAQALGITIPPTLLLLADEVIR